MTHETPVPCEACGHTDWRNPTPVIVLLPCVVDRFGNFGLAIARRAIEPMSGGWALLAGHVEEGESLENAAMREFQEETGLDFLHRDLRYIQSLTVDNKLLAGFAIDRPFTIDEWSQARLCPENSEFGTLWGVGELDKLCFPLHRWFARKWFEPES